MRRMDFCISRWHAARPPRSLPWTAATSPRRRAESSMQESTGLAQPDSLPDSDDILFGREGGVATVMLNRPRALNAFTLGMYRRFDPMLRTWEEDPTIRAVLVRGAGELAFCAGGDVRAVSEAGRGISGARDLTSVFFWEEYELIRRVHHYPKPYLAIIDGITMGGGAGVSVNGAYRIATEKTLLSM